MSDLIVIGGGLNGLVAAALLAKRRLRPIVLERQPTAGGAAITGEIATGFRAPRLSHALGPLRRDVVRALRLDRIADLEFLTPDPSLTTLGTNGEALSFHPDAVLTAGSIDRVSAADAGRWRPFLHATHRITRIAAEIWRHTPPSLDEASMRERWRLLRTARLARKLGRGEMARMARWLTMPMSDLLDEWFGHELLKAAIAAHAIFGHFAGPRSPGTGAMWLQRLAADPAPAGGAVWIRGGPGALTNALVGLVERAGGAVRTNAAVSRVVVSGNRITRVVLETGEEIEARAVIAAVDPRQLFLRLVEPDDLAPTFLEKIRRYRARGVTAKINLALSGLPEFTALRGDPVAARGRLLIAPDLDYLERAFDAAKYGSYSPAPWLELMLPSTLDDSLAPEGRHVMSICAHFAPYDLRDRSWTDTREALYAAVLHVLSRHAPDIAAMIVGREILTPEDLERQWGLSGGHIFHGETALDQTWIARPVLGWSRYRTPIDGLYLAGAGTHPGGGLTGGSGFLAAQAVLRALSTEH